ncbi:MAG: hypothetical protein M1820_008740 [Bogoriella megaspora]|nr:MAG: hypothetical protein M1820_008740 [Bogoriella megaspora]
MATDKLIAISGVARYMQATLWGSTPLQYYAGHWSHDFEIQLTWSASLFSAGRRSETYIAPSWSWASYDGEVSFPYPSRVTLWAKLIHISVSPVTDPFGMVSSGFIRMRGPLCMAVATRSADVVDEDERDNTLLLLGTDTVIDCVDLGFDKSIESGSATDNAEQQSQLVLFGIKQAEDSSDRPFEGISLRLTGHQRGQYRRVGGFRVDEYLPRSLEEEQRRAPEYALFPNGGAKLLEQDHFGALMDAFHAMDMPEEFFEQRGDN